MSIMNIILILLYCLILSFQKIKSGLFCDDRIVDIYVYDERSGDYRHLQTLNNSADCNNVDYVDLDVDPGALIKFSYRNDAEEALRGECFLINNNCHCYEFDSTEGFGHDGNQYRDFYVNFNNGVTCSHKARLFRDKRQHIYEYLHKIPLDVNKIECNPQTISAPINSKRSIKFSEFIVSPFNVTNLNISIFLNNQIFTLNNQQLSTNTKFNILSDLEYSHDQISKINIRFKIYGLEIFNNEKIYGFDIMFIKNSYLNIIIPLIIGVVLIIIAIFFFIKRFVSRKKSEGEISNNIKKIDSNNQLINVYL